MPAIPELTEPLTDGVVALRQAAERDIPEILIAYQDDHELHLRLGEARPPSGAELGRRTETFEEGRRSGAGLTLTITLRPGDDCIGQLTVSELDWENGRAQLSIWLAPQARGQGHGSRALVLASRHLIAACDLARLQILVDTENVPMRAAAERAGFTPEGVLPGYHRRGSARIDMAILSLLPSDLQSDPS